MKVRKIHNVNLNSDKKKNICMYKQIYDFS